MSRSDPHVALGIEHGQQSLPPYQWQDAEHQRRYDLGYLVGRGARRTAYQQGMNFAELEKCMRLAGRDDSTE